MRGSTIQWGIIAFVIVSFFALVAFVANIWVTEDRNLAVIRACLLSGGDWVDNNCTKP